MGSEPGGEPGFGKGPRRPGRGNRSRGSRTRGSRERARESGRSGRSATAGAAGSEQERPRLRPPPGGIGRGFLSVGVEPGWRRGDASAHGERTLPNRSSTSKAGQPRPGPAAARALRPPPWVPGRQEERVQGQVPGLQAVARGARAAPRSWEAALQERPAGTLRSGAIREDASVWGRGLEARSGDAAWRGPDLETPVAMGRSGRHGHGSPVFGGQPDRPSGMAQRDGPAGWPSEMAQRGQPSGSTKQTNQADQPGGPATWARQAKGPSCGATGHPGPAPRGGLRRPRGARRPGATAHAVRHRGPRGSAVPAGGGGRVAARGGDPMPARAGPSSRRTSRRSRR